jgi:aminopeptidase N
MAENFLTLPTFKKGVSSYLSNNSFGNAERDDLWQSLTDAAKEDKRLPDDVSVKDIMDSWTSEPGYPVLTVTSSTGNQVPMLKNFLICN